MHKYLFLIILVILSCSKRIENADELGSADNFYRKGESYYSKNNDSAFILIKLSINIKKCRIQQVQLML